MKKARDRILRNLQSFAGQPWYVPMVCALSVLDGFLCVVPLIPLLLPAIACRPRRWFAISLAVGFSCALGAVLVAGFAGTQGRESLLQHWPGLFQSPTWKTAEPLLSRYGAVGLFAMGVSPVPQQPALILAGLGHLSLWLVFGIAWASATLKFSVVNGIISAGSRYFFRSELA